MILSQDQALTALIQLASAAGELRRCDPAMFHGIMFSTPAGGIKTPVEMIDDASVDLAVACERIIEHYHRTKQSRER